MCIRDSDAFRAQMHESRPMPPGLSDSEWTQYVPRAPAGSGDELRRPITPLEVYLIVFPASAHLKRDFSRCHEHCLQCGDFEAQLHAWVHDSSQPPPRWLPHLSTSKAAGPDGLRAEAIAWAAPELPSQRYAYRMEVATALAGLFNAMLREGRPPSAEFVQSTLTPVLKSAKPGQPVDAGHPDYYRGIAVGNSLAKLLSLVLVARISHWSLRHDLISHEQVGFLWRHAAEEHVFTLTQSIKARLRAGLPTFALFVDFRKAYDMVHLPLLWSLLRTMGVPDETVCLLSAMANTRTTQVRINGELSPPFPVEAGVPQGDPLSCLLFILFIESLSRFLSARLTGVIAAGVTIRHLLFADDLAILTADPGELQMALDLIKQWCDAWGMQVGTGQGKTEAMAFTREDGASVLGPDLPPLSYGGTPIAWSSMYRYLGHMTSTDLAEGVMIGRLRARLRSGFHRYFTRNGVVRSSSVATQLQLYQSTTLVATEYLRCILSIDAATRSQLDVEAREAARAIIGLPHGTSNLLVECVSRLLPAQAVMIRERERLLQQLLLTPHRDSLAAQLYRGLAAEPRTRSSTRSSISNWAHVANAARAKAARGGAIFEEPQRYSDISRVAHVAARSWAHAQSKRVTEAAHGGPPPTGYCSVPPASVGSARHAHAIYHGLSVTGAALGRAHGHTPVSAHGAACSGSLLALSHSRRYPAATAALRGAEALHVFPFGDRPRPLRNEAVEIVGAGPEPQAGAWRHTSDAPYESRFVDAPCRLCGGGTESLYHIVTECTHPAMLAMQHEVMALQPIVIRHVWELGVAAAAGASRRQPHEAAPQLTQAEEDALQQLTSAASATAPRTAPEMSDTERFISYWVLLGVPWSSTAHGPAHGPAISALGKLFDDLNVAPRWLRTWSHHWLSGSEQRIRLAARHWRAAVGLPHLPCDDATHFSWGEALSDAHPVTTCTTRAPLDAAAAA